jgi:DNA processing protein
LNQEICLIWLNEIESISLTQKKALLYLHDTPMAIFEYLKDKISDDSLLDKAKEIYEINQKHNIKTLALFDLMKHKPIIGQLPWPILVYYKGSLNYKKSVALVGTRKMSTHGYYFTEQLCDKVAQGDAIINTGLSDGIEKKTLEFCIEKGYHANVFVAHGLNTCSPKSKSSLMELAASKGTILSPFSVLSKQHRLSFLERNALLAMWSDELVLVEADATSKSANVIDYGIKFNKKTSTILGPTDSKRCELNNQLIREKSLGELSMSLNQDIEMMINHPVSKILREKAMSRDDLSLIFSNINIDSTLAKLEFMRIASCKANGKWYYNGW